MARHAKKLKQIPDWKLLLWTAIAGLVFGLIGVGQIVEDPLRTVRNGMHKHRASGDIVLVLIDERSLREVGMWPWPRQQDAKLIDSLAQQHAREIFFDINFGARDES